MRPDHGSQHEHRPRPSTNGSASSPHTNGSAKSGETNGFHTNDHAEERGGVRNSEPFYGHDREEVTRILLQSLENLGYHSAARQLSDDSGYELEIPSVASFRNAVLSGEWDDAEALLFGSEGVAEFESGGVSLGNGHSANSPTWPGKSRLSVNSPNGYARHGLPLAEGADTTMLKFLLRQQKYLELLEQRDPNSALSVLRNELTPLKRDVKRLHELSSLMMCHSSDDLRHQASWDGADGQSRSHLLSEISKSISPSVMIPEHRLATLFSAVQEEQILNCRYHNTIDQPSLYTDHECSADGFPLQVLTELRNHSDEVWHLEFSHDGSMLATAGKDGAVCIYDTRTWSIRSEIREHERGGSADAVRGVCYIAWSPDDQYLISCSQNNEFVVIETREGRRVAYGDHFDYPVTTAAWLPDSTQFVIGTQGSRKPLGLYSLRNGGNGSSSSSVLRNNELHTWRDPPWDPTLKDNANSFRITDCAVNAAGTRMVATTIENKIMLYALDILPSRPKIAEWTMDDKLTSISFSSDGQDILINMNEGRVLALDADTGEVRMRYEGVVQHLFVIRSCFGGAGENFVMSGSEDSRVYVWRRQTGVQVAVLEHGPGTVNAVAWHPRKWGVFASAGDDRRVRM
jgi:WD repeat-containing protein 26